MKRLGNVFLFVLVVVVILGLVWFVLNRGARLTADLAAIKSDVEHWDAGTDQRASVPTGEHRKIHTNDAVNVNQSGRARLDVSGCLIDIYRNTDLQVEALPTLSAQVCILQLGRGTTLNQVEKKTIYNTEWAVVTARGTEFLVHVDPQRGLLWVVVKAGVVDVEAAGVRVEVRAGEQTWVQRGGRPEPARPATRRDVGDLFPPLEELTGGELDDGRLLILGPEPITPPTPEPQLTRGPEPPTPEPLRLSLEQSTDRLFSGECGEPQTIQIVATLSGSPEAIADVGRASLTYLWSGIEEQTVRMERVDDDTFAVEIGPFDYCCQQTVLEYRVEVFGSSRTPVITGAGKAQLEFCIG